MLSDIRRAGFIEPCLPSPADHPPSGSSWIHEIKHDGYRLITTMLLHLPGYAADETGRFYSGGGAGDWPA